MLKSLLNSQGYSLPLAAIRLKGDRIFHILLIVLRCERAVLTRTWLGLAYRHRPVRIQPMNAIAVTIFARRTKVNILPRLSSETLR